MEAGVEPTKSVAELTVYKTAGLPMPNSTVVRYKSQYYCTIWSSGGGARMKVDKQQFDAVLGALIRTPPMKKSDIVSDSRRGRPRKNQPARPRKSSR